MRAHRRDRSGESGQALVELALIAPILILLLVSIFQFAFVFETEMGITNAVREAARRAAAVEDPTEAWVREQLCGTNPTCDDGLLADNVLGFNPSRLAPGDPAISFCTYDINGVPQYRVEVAVTYQHPEFFPLAQIAALAAGKPSGGAWDWTVGASAQMRLEHDLATLPPACT